MNGKLSSRFSFTRTVRGRLLLSAILVEAVMLLLLVSNSLRLLHQNMTTQEERHANQLAPVLLAALVAPMAQRDYATVQSVLDDSNLESDVVYLVVTNSSGAVVASSGWDSTKPLPQADATFEKFKNSEGGVFQVVRPIKVETQQLGTLHFGLDLSPVVAARQAMLTQGISIALVELLLSIGMLTLLGIWLTRHLAALTQVSREVASGNLSPPTLTEGKDDIGQLCAAFNAMSHAVSERVTELTKAHNIQSSLIGMVNREQSRMIALLKAMDIGVMLLDMDGKIIYENPAFRNIFNIGPTKTLVGEAGREILAAVSPELLQSASPASCIAPSPDSNPQGREVAISNEKIVSERIHVVTDDEGSVIGQLYLFEDITISKQIAQQLITAKEAAEASKKTQAAFLATMSHEIRTPMNGIIGMANLVSATQLTPEQQEYLGWVKSSADSLLTVLNDVLDFSKIDSGALSLESIPFSISGLMDELIGLHRTIADQKNIRLSWHAHDNLPAVTVGDPVRLRQILTNLVSNALKFTEQGHVTLSVSIEKNTANKTWFHFSVSDTGIGIPAELQEHIFSPFAQADSSITRKFGGTGLGLAIVKRLVELLDGEIQIESAVGRGSKFHVRVPLETPTASAMRKISHSAPSAEVASRTDEPTESKKILLVEDTPVNQRLGQLLLTALGHKVVLATDGIEAIAAFEREPLDLILMDMQMPNMDGLEATRRIREIENREDRNSRIPIVALTANAMQSDRKRCLDAGMNDYISKPFKPEQITAILKRDFSRDSYEFQ